MNNKKRSSDLKWTTVLLVFLILMVANTVIGGIPTFGGGLEGFGLVMLNYFGYTAGIALPALIIGGLMRSKKAIVVIMVIGFFMASLVTYTERKEASEQQSHVDIDEMHREAPQATQILLDKGLIKADGFVPDKQALREYIGVPSQ